MAARSTGGAAGARASLPGGLEMQLVRRCLAESLGTAVLVFVGAGVSTVTFGFRAYGESVAAGMLTTALAFALVLTGLVATIGPISGSHVNPAVTLGAFLIKRMDGIEAAWYVIAQLIGALIGALLLLWVMHGSPFYSRSRIGLGANGYGKLSLLHTSGGGAFLAEVILTAIFVFVVLAATRKEASPPIAGVVIGVTFGVAYLLAIPIDGGSLNPARSFGPAIVGGGQPLSQLWLFLIAPLIGGVLGTGLHLLFHPLPPGSYSGGLAARIRAVSAASDAAADTDGRPASGQPGGQDATPGHDDGPAASSAGR